MPLPVIAVGGIWAWLVGLFASVVGTFMTWLLTHFVWRTAIKILVVTGFVVAVAGFFLSMTVGLKALVIGARLVLPTALQQVTYFLPANCNQVFALLITARCTVFLFKWSASVMKMYARTVY